ncbi:MAG TPA: carboxylating nicotinate-nucleotide diphosphorylase [Gemmatimonadales bacterium]|nr:carboxylating nicotinate-nucleotide diphosphorylase [Gemmatimonadales bacterium]
MPSTSEVQRIAAAALAEDGQNDLTSSITIPPGLRAEGCLEYRSGGVLAGTAYADAVISACRCTVEWQVKEGDTVRAGSVIGIIRGELHSILRAERPLLNLLQRASGIATATRAYVDAVEGTGCRILHTRKTAPGLRSLDVAGVIAGGGHPHRLDLEHEVMVKDNHWQALAGGGTELGKALAAARRQGVTALYVEVESLNQLREACAAGATRLLIDNQSPETLRTWAGEARRQSADIEIEATGGVTLGNVRAYAEAGADFISIGALTHSVQAADVALEISPPRPGSKA